MNYSFSLELRFVLMCSKEALSKVDIDFINKKLPSIDYKSLIDLASRHGVMPLIYKTLKTLKENKHLFDNHYTNKILEDTKSIYLRTVQQNMLMSAELIHILKILEREGIDVLVFKGPILSKIAYGDITLRQYGDLDILIKKEDIHRVDEILKSYGYERALSMTPAQEEIWFKYSHDLGLIHKEKDILLEIHWSFLDEDYPLTLELENLWEDTQIVDINGYPIKSFSIENLLIYLCIHGSKHLWERIEWIKDIDMLIRNNKIVWAKVLKKADNTEFEKMIYFGLAISRKLFNTPLPLSIKNKIELSKEIPSLIDFVFDSWVEPKSTPKKTMATLKLLPTPKDKLLYLHKVVLKPTFNEYWFIDLPDNLYFLYYFIRPYLLIKKQFQKGKNQEIS